jgi:hypothetical protein
MSLRVTGVKLDPGPGMFQGFTPVLGPSQRLGDPPSKLGVIGVVTDPLSEELDSHFGVVDVQVAKAQKGERVEGVLLEDMMVRVLGLLGLANDTLQACKADPSGKVLKVVCGRFLEVAEIPLSQLLLAQASGLDAVQLLRHRHP